MSKGDYEEWFPRSYDFTEERQIQAFLHDFKCNSILNYVKKHAIYFKSIHKKELKRVKCPVRRYKERYLVLPDGDKNVINVMMLKTAIAFIKYKIKLRKDVLCGTEIVKCDKNLFEILTKLGKYKGPPYSSEVLESIKQIAPAGWSVPSFYLEYKTLMVIKEFNKYYPQSKVMGSENIWIVKPSYSSRGIGIYCTNSPDIPDNKKLRTKIMQKYIERTFLLSLPGPKGKLEKRKFDLRQWVLVTSYSPLVIYMFNSCYFKICGSEFVLDDIKDKYRHISNFSIQKNNERVSRSELIMSVTQFVDHLREHFGIEIDWQKDMVPKLAKIIKNTMYAGWDVIEHKSNSFELYGFDFILDYKLNPWLIEVNRSPACSERADWLINMLGTPSSKQ